MAARCRLSLLRFGSAMSEWGQDGVRTALVDLADLSDLRTAVGFSGSSLSELQWNSLRFAAVPALFRSGDLLAVVPKAAGAQGGALVSPRTAPLSTQLDSVQNSKGVGGTGASVLPLSEAGAGHAGLSSGQLNARLQAAGPPPERLHDERPTALHGASSSNHLTLQTYSAAQGSTFPLARFSLPKASHAAQRASPRSPGAGNLDAASLLSAFVQQNNDLLRTLTRIRALVVLAVLLGRVAENSGLHQLGWLLTGMLNPSFQLVQFLPQQAQANPEGFLGPLRWVGANPAYFKDVDYPKGRAKLVGKQPLSDRPRGPSPKPKAKPKEAPKAAAKAAAGWSETQWELAVQGLA